jgi:hypothetical protein
LFPTHLCPYIGNENLHNLTSMAPMTLRVDLRAGDESVFAKYSAFTVDTVRRNYALKVSGYSGTAGMDRFCPRKMMDLLLCILPHNH